MEKDDDASRWAVAYTFQVKEKEGGHVKCGT